MCGLMKFAAGEGQHPLEDLDWSEHYSFPRELILVGFRVMQPVQNNVLNLLCHLWDFNILSMLLGHILKNHVP